MFQIEFIADENIDFRTIKLLRDNGYSIISICENFKGISDKEIIELAKKYKAVIITRDKDFGEWVYSYNEKNAGIILLRYKFNEISIINENILKIVKQYDTSLIGNFTVIQKDKIRIRKL